MKKLRFLLATLMAVTWGQAAWAQQDFYTDANGIVYGFIDHDAFVQSIPDALTTIAPLNEIIKNQTDTFRVKGFSSSLLTKQYNFEYTHTTNWKKVILPPNFTANLYFLGGCQNLESVEFSAQSKLETLPIGLLRNNPLLSHVVLPPLLKSISDSCFTNCSKLTSITLPNSVKTIGRAAFAFSGLTTLDASQVTSVGDEAFASSAIRSIQLPLVTIIPPGAFRGSSISNIQIPNVTMIGKRAFEETTIQTISLPRVTEIADSAFMNSALTVLDGPNMVTIGQRAFYFSQALTTINIPKVETIGAEAFCNCSGLTGFNWGSNVLRTIGDRAFAEVLPNATPVTLRFSNPDLMLGYQAFYNEMPYPARALTIDCLSPAVEGYPMPMISSAFNDGQKRFITVRVPAGMGQPYRAMYGWQQFKIVEDLSGVTLSEYEEVSSSFSGWFGQYSASQLSAVKRLKVKGKLYADDWETLRQMCDGSVSGVSLRMLDLSEAQLTDQDMTFSGFSSLDTLCLPKSHRYTGEECGMQGCKSNLVVIVSDQTPPVADDAYFACAVEGMTLIVPAGTYSKYSARTGWRLFGNMRPADGISESPWVSFAFRSTAAGSLAAALQTMSDKEQHMLSGLTVSGPLNSTDLREIRRLCGVPYALGSAATGYNVTYLDLADASFVQDATAFCNNGNYDCNIPAANVIPAYAFSGLTQVDTLWLPSSARELKASIFKQANPTMKVFILSNDPGSFTLYESTFSSDVAQMTLVVPAGRLSAYQKSTPNYGFPKFGHIVAGKFEGIGDMPVEVPDALTLNICNGDPVGAAVAIQYMKSNQLQTIYVSRGTSTHSILRSDIATGGGHDLHLVVYTTRNISVYLDNEDITQLATKTIREDKGDTCYDFDYAALGFNNANTYEADIFILFADAVQTDMRTVRLSSNTLDQDGIVFTMLDKNEDGTTNYDTAETLRPGEFHSIPASKVIQMYLPLANGNPREEGVLTLNGSFVKNAAPGYESSNCQYEVLDLSAYTVWDFELTVHRDGDPNPDYVSHHINFIDASAQASMSYSYNTSAGEAETVSVNEGVNTFSLPKVTYDQNTCFVDMAIKVPAGYRLTVSKANVSIDWMLTKDEQTLTEDGVDYDVYHMRSNEYEYRMADQAFVVQVKEPDAVKEWNVTLLEGSSAVFTLEQANGKRLDDCYVWESGIVPVSEKAASVTMVVGTPQQSDEFFATHDLVVMADGVDLSSLFTTEPAWVGNMYGLGTLKPLTGDILNATNWIIGYKAKDATMATWSLQAKDDVPDGAQAEVSLGTMTLSVGADQTSDAGTMSDADPATAQKSTRIVVPAGYAFKLWFNGADLTSRLSLASTDAEGRKVYTASFASADVMSQLAVDGSWTVLFMDKNKNYDLNGDGQVTIADVTMLVDVILQR